METVRHILQIKGNDVWTIRPDDTVLEALRRMANKSIGALVVMEGDQLVGILSERDYARKVILQGRHSENTPVREIMTAEVVTIHPDQTLDEAMALMDSRSIRHLPVVEDGKVIGVISIRDVMRAIIRRQREVIRHTEPRVYSD